MLSLREKIKLQMFPTLSLSAWSKCQDELILFVGDEIRPLLNVYNINEEEREKIGKQKCESWATTYRSYERNTRKADEQKKLEEEYEQLQKQYNIPYNKSKNIEAKITAILQNKMACEEMVDMVLPQMIDYVASCICSPKNKRDDLEDLRKYLESHPPDFTKYVTIFNVPNSHSNKDALTNPSFAKARWWLYQVFYAYKITPVSYASSAFLRFLRGMGKQKGMTGSGIMSVEKGFVEEPIKLIAELFFNKEIMIPFGESEDIGINSDRHYDEEEYDKLYDAGAAFSATTGKRNHKMIDYALSKLEEAGMTPAQEKSFAPKKKEKQAFDITPGTLLTEKNISRLPDWCELVKGNPLTFTKNDEPIIFKISNEHIKNLRYLNEKIEVIINNKFYSFSFDPIGRDAFLYLFHQLESYDFKDHSKVRIQDHQKQIEERISYIESLRFAFLRTKGKYRVITLKGADVPEIFSCSYLREYFHEKIEKATIVIDGAKFDIEKLNSFEVSLADGALWANYDARRYVREMNVYVKLHDLLPIKPVPLFEVA